MRFIGSFCFTTLLLTFVSPDVRAQVPLAGWEMDEGSGTRIFDCSGNGHDSSDPISATYISPGHDGTGSALNFNGNGQWAKIGGDLGALEPPLVTIVAYIRTPDPGHGTPVSYLLTKTPHGNQGPSYGLSVFENINDNLRFNILVAGSGTGTGSVSIVSTNWKQVVASFDGTTARLYFDGVLRSSTPLSGPIDYNTFGTNGLAIGQYENGGYWNGDVDGLRIYGQVLTPDEIPPSCVPGPGWTPPGLDIVVTPAAVDGNGAPIVDPPAVTLVFDQVDTGGETTVTITGPGPPPPGGLKLGSPPTYFDLDTTATFTGNVEVCINYSTIQFGGPASNLSLRHFVDGMWDNVLFPSNDTEFMVICGSVESFSFFAIFEPHSTVPSLSVVGIAILLSLLGASAYWMLRTERSSV